MSGYDAPPNAKTQRGEILALLVKARGEWVPLPDVLALGCAQYNARIFELRRVGFNIENRTETVDGERHSWFRLLPSTSGKPEPEAVPESDFMRRRREEEAQQNPLFGRGAA